MSRSFASWALVSVMRAIMSWLVGLFDVALKMTTSFSSPARLEAIAPIRLLGVLEAGRCGGDNLTIRWYPSFFAPTDCGVVKSVVWLRNSSLPSVPLFFGSRSSNARKCSFRPFKRLSSLLLLPANRIRPSFVERLSRHVIESSLLASISAIGCTVDARELKSNAVIWFFIPDRPALKL